MTILKTCTVCGEKKQQSVKYFQRNKGPDGKNYYTDDCLLCKVKAESSSLKNETQDVRITRAAAKLQRQQEKYRVKDAAKKRREYREQKKKASEKEAELARRILAKRKLLHFIKRFHPGYQAGWVHYDICRRLEKFYRDVRDGKSPRLMLFMPPRHGKSEIASNYFPSWSLGHSPEFEIIAASYAVSLPIGFSRKVRARINDPAYRAMFPQTVQDKESKSAEAWLTKSGGGYVAAGVGGGITGKGAHILIIDDPVKDAEEADSENQREKVWDWYGSTAYTRLSPGGGVLVIQTRWHDDDLSGRLMQQMKDLKKEGVPDEEIDNWEIIEYPAEATKDEYLNKDGTITQTPKLHTSMHLRDKGDPLHEERFPIERLKRIKRSLQPRHWSALYQQNPVPDEGVYFTKTMFRYVQSPPPFSTLRMYAAWDLAIGEKQQNDYTVGVVGGVDHNDQLYILDVIRFKGDAHRIVESILDVHRKYDPYLIGIEKGQLEHSIRPQLKKRMSERRQFPSLAEGKKALVPISDKLTRARPLQGRMQQGMVYFHAGQPWLEEARHEMMRFPGGVHDDIVDAVAWLARMTMNESPPKQPKSEKLETWKDKLKGHGPRGRSVDPMLA